jgi:hypothetical protein
MSVADAIHDLTNEPLQRKRNKKAINPFKVN